MMTERSADPVPTVVVAVTLSLPGFGSVVADATVAVLLITVPTVTPAPTCTTREKTALADASEAIEQETVPAAPTAGVVQLQPPGAASDTKVVPADRVSDNATVAALLGPMLLTVIV